VLSANRPSCARLRVRRALRSQLYADLGAATRRRPSTHESGHGELRLPVPSYHRP